MKKKTRRRMTDSEPSAQRRLQLARETVRTLEADDLSLAVGGSCITPSWTTDPQPTGHH